MTFTGFIGRVFMFPLRAIISASVALGIHPNILTLIGVLINVGAGDGARPRALHPGRRHHDRRQHLRLHRRQGRPHHQHGVAVRRLLGFDARSLLGHRALHRLIYLYADLRRTDYVMVTALALTFSIMTSYARARAESLIDKCKVGFMERPSASS
jgi:CDP-diacylglycerol--glycerol-3-phosphate 3-phosphatidyltransferase